MTRNYHTAEHYELAYEWWQELDEGQPSRYLAKILGVTFVTILQWRRRETRPDWRKIRTSDLMIQKIEDMLNDGASHSEISRTLGVGGETIKKYFPGTAWSMEQTIDYLTTRRLFAQVVSRDYYTFHQWQYGYHNFKKPEPWVLDGSGSVVVQRGIRQRDEW